MNLGMQGKNALVVGGSRGLGLASAQALVQEGANVVVASRTAREGLPGRQEFSAAVTADLSEAASIDLAVEQALSILGSIDILVVSGGGPPPSSALNLSADALSQACVELLLPVRQLVSLLVPQMQANGWGRVVVIGSSGVQQPIPQLAASNAVRNAVAGFLKTLANEVAHDGVTVNMAIPGRINTERVRSLDKAASERLKSPIEHVKSKSISRIPAGRYGEVVEFALPVAFLCSDAASYITGSQLRIDGGLISAV